MEGVPPERDAVTGGYATSNPPTGGCPPGATLQGGKGGKLEGGTTRLRHARGGGGRDEVTDSVTTPVTSSPESPGVTPPRIFFKLVGRLIDSGLLPQSPQFHWGVI